MFDKKNDLDTSRRVPEKKYVLDRRTDGQQSDPIWVPFFLSRYGTLKINTLI